ncbi:transmembrane protein 145-like, partial [Saccoglossus kowalevskii]
MVMTAMIMVAMVMTAMIMVAKKGFHEENFKFIDRFCFQPNEVGQMTFEFKYEADECCYTLLMFNDEPFQWPFVRKHGASMTCGELKELIPGSYNAKMTLTDPFNGCTRTNNHTDGIEYMKCKGTRNFVTVRERWWYIVMSHCYYDTGLHIEYKITMTNGNKIWDRHFSADERYIFETDFTFLFLYLFALIVTLYYIKILKERRLLHSTYKMFVFSMVFENISLFFMNIQLGTYAQDGVGLPKLKVL